LNNNRKYFGTDGIRGKVGDMPMHPEFLIKLGWAIGNILANNHHGRVVIGKDTRISGYLLESAIVAGLSAAGTDSYLLGPMPTPAIAYITREMNFDAGIVLSASHNPYHDNGLKIFSNDGFKLSDEIEFEIENLIDDPLTVVSNKKIGKSYRLDDAPRKYIEYCKSILPSHIDFSNLKIVLDCANGAAYQIAPLIFEELGFNVIVINNTPDGININKDCGSTHPEVLQDAVKSHQASLGIAFDGDADRVIFVDDNGDIVDGDELIYIIASHQQAQHTLKGGVIGTLMTNFGIERALQSLEIPFVRSKVGDRYVLAQLKAHDWQLGGESSGHIIHLDFSTTGDGILSALLALWALKESGISLSDYKGRIKKYPQYMINVPMHKPINDKQRQQIELAVKEIQAELGDKGRVLLRPSGTEPLMRVMVESNEPSLTQSLTEQLAETVKKILAP